MLHIHILYAFAYYYLITERAPSFQTHQLKYENVVHTLGSKYNTVNTAHNCYLLIKGTLE